VPVVERDARLLAAGAPALAAALSDCVGEPTLVVLTGPGLAAPPDARAVQELPLVLAAPAPVDPTVAAALDLVLEGDQPERVTDGFLRAPAAATAAALLLRTPPATWWDGLVRESTTYSMLQGSDEFRRWRAAQGTPQPAGDTGPRVRVAQHGRVTELTLTRAARHNALDVAMRDELFAALAAAEGPVVLLGEGPSFCSGGDLDEFGTFPDPALAHVVRLSRSLAGQCATRHDRLVVGLHGASLGAGIELAAFACRVVATDDARVGLPELGLGLVPGAGGTVSLPRRVGRHRTLALLLHDGTISAPAALGWGLVDEVVPFDRLRSRCLELAESLP
jgi:enoyl-CoA hydratase/carnithine racemase